MSARANLLAASVGRSPFAGGYEFTLGAAGGGVRTVAVGDFVELEQVFDVTGVVLVRLAARTGPHPTLSGDLSWRVSAWLDATKVAEVLVGASLRDVSVPIGAATGAHRVAIRLELMGTAGTYSVTLPTVTLEALALDTTSTGAMVVNRSPAPDEGGVAVAQVVQFDLVDAAGVTAPTIVSVEVSQALAYDGAFQAGFSGSVVAAPLGAGWRVQVARAAPFASGEVVPVRVVSMLGSTLYTSEYTFTAADVLGPVLVSALALDRTVVELRFDEPASLAVGDVTLVGVAPGSVEVLAPVPAEVVAVSGELSSTVVLTLSTELTAGALYTVEATAQDAVGNINTSTTGVVGYACAQPAGRDFDLWKLLPLVNRSEDSWPFDLRRFVNALQEVADWLLCDIDRFTRIFDLDLAPEQFLDVILVQLGNPFKFDLTVGDKRKLAGLLVAIYQQKGTADGIVNTIRFFVGLDVQITYPGWATGWTLGVDQLGTTSFLSTDDAFTRYSYRIVSPVTLSSEQRSRINTLAQYMQPAHEHLIEIVEPAPPPIDPDHWELGLSELGVSTILH